MNNKFYGKKTEYLPIREDRSRTIVSYGQESVSDTHCTWYEVYFSKSENHSPSIEQIKDAILADINERIKAQIIGGMIWSGQPVWLSLENQSNFSTAEHRAATTGDNLPHKEKIGQESDGTPIYHTFDTAAELTSFWNACQDHIENCRNAGWEEKDAIDWSEYERLLSSAEE